MRDEKEKLPQIKRVAIVGAGAIGGYYGGRLQKTYGDEIEVHFLLRSDFDAVSKNGWSVQSIAGDFQLNQVLAARDSQDIGPVDLVIIAWKTTSNHLFEKVIPPLLHEKTQILTLQNGLGNVELLASLFGSERVYGGLCFVCVNRVAPGEIVHTASGQIRVGKYQESSLKERGRLLTAREKNKLNNLVEFLSLGGLDCRSVDSLEWAQWSKLVWNIPFNGLAITEGGVDTQVLLSSPETEARIKRLMKEVQSVALALGYEIKDSFIDQQIAVTKTMGAYRPSSMIDFVMGRPVEVDAIWREPCRRADAVHVPVPEMQKLLKEIEQMTEEMTDQKTR